MHVLVLVLVSTSSPHGGLLKQPLDNDKIHWSLISNTTPLSIGVTVASKIE